MGLPGTFFLPRETLADVFDALLLVEETLEQRQHDATNFEVKSNHSCIGSGKECHTAVVRWVWVAASLRQPTAELELRGQELAQAATRCGPHPPRRQ